MTGIHLELRVPSGVVIDRPVRSIRAEDRTGWFGIRPGRADLVAILPSGLLLFDDEEGEWFVALSGGLLHMEGGKCQVAVREAVVSRDLDAVAAEVDRQVRRRRERGTRQREVIEDLVKEAMRRLIAEARV
jgi:F-type H+-transporting ATPase subunit epsilon